MKKFIAFVLLCCMVISPISIYASTDSTKDPNYEYDLVGSKIFPAPKSINTVISPRYVSTDPGTVKIDDYLAVANGFVPDNYQSFTSYNTAKSILFKVISFIPYANKVAEIISWVSDVDSDLEAYMDKEAQFSITTRYDERPFYHDMYVWGYDESWEYIGYSKSNYYYTQILIDYLRTDVGRSDTAVVNKSEDQGYAPHSIKAAEHFLDYDYLRFRAKYEWEHNGLWNEYPSSYIETPSNYPK